MMGDGTSSSSSSNNSNNDDSVVSALSRGDFEKGYELFQHDMEKGYGMFQQDVEIYINSFGDIERDTGIPLSTMHDWIITGGGGCVASLQNSGGGGGGIFEHFLRGNQSSRGHQRGGDDDPYEENTVEVHYNGSNKNVINCSLERHSYHEVDVIPNKRSRKGLFGGLSLKRSMTMKRTMSFGRKHL